DSENELREAIVALRRAADDAAHDGHVARRQPAAERVDHELLDERRYEDLRLSNQRLPELDRAAHLAAVEQPSARVDSIAPDARFVLAPRPDGVEILEREADRIHDRVARGAHGILPVRLETLAQRQVLADDLVERRHVGGGSGRRRAEQIAEDPVAADDR